MSTVRGASVESVETRTSRRCKTKGQLVTHLAFTAQTHILVLRTGFSLPKQLLLNPPSCEVALHPILERLSRRVRPYSEPQQRLDDDPHALVSARGTEARLVENAEEGGEQVGERGGGDDRVREGSEVREEEDLRLG